MDIQFIGVGEAFEPQLGNASYLIRSDSTLLVDCGYGVPRNLFTYLDDPDAIDVIYFTHFHADHTFGLPAVLNRWNEDNRTKPLIMIGQPGLQKFTNQILDLAYSFCRRNLKFDLNFVETTQDYSFRELDLAFAKTDHGMSNYAISIARGDCILGISGDGGLTAETRELFRNCRYLVHEAFGYEEAMKGHTTALKVVEYCHTLPALKVLALVHLHRTERASRIKDFKKLNEKEPFEVIIPSPGDTLQLH